MDNRAVCMESLVSAVRMQSNPDAWCGIPGIRWATYQRAL